MDNTKNLLKTRTYFVHEWLIKAGTVVDPDQFAHVFSTKSPPIGWHLWHMARFADRLQSKLAAVTSGAAAAELWYQQGISAQWGVSAGDLGVFESGMGQSHLNAQATIKQAGQAAVVAYAEAAFAACNAQINRLSRAQFDSAYLGILDYGYDAKTGAVWQSEPKENSVAQDVIFHVTHGSRHMGMMEALRGLLGSAGTLSV